MKEAYICCLATKKNTFGDRSRNEELSSRFAAACERTKSWPLAGFHGKLAPVFPGHLYFVTWPRGTGDTVAVKAVSP